MLKERFIDVDCKSDQKTNCPIKLGQVYCDGYNRDARIGVFSHFHEDHINPIRDCLGSYDKLIVHPITFQAISALFPGYQYYEQWIPQDYDTKYVSSVGDIRLLKSNHIPGSCQVHVETRDSSCLYSGDFNYPEMQIREAKYLVLDATHGDPWHDGKTDRKSVMNRMFEDIKEKIKSNKAVMIHTSTGTLQEIIHHFEMGISGDTMSHDIPFVAALKQKDLLNKIYPEEKKEFRDIIVWDSREFWKLDQNNKRCVIFLTNEMPDNLFQNYYNIIVGKYRFQVNNAAIIPTHNGCRYNLASHASIHDIIEYVDQIKAKEVITDNSRSAYAPMLAKLIHIKWPDVNAYSRP